MTRKDYDMDITVSPSLSGITGEITLPPSKSVSHRVLFCAGLCGGESKISRLLASADSDATLRVLAALGCEVNRLGEDILVRGVSPVEYSGNETITVDCGESGSTLRFAIPLLSLTGKTVKLTGAPRLMERPQSVYREIFEGAGLLFEQDSESVTIKGSLKPGKYHIKGDISSQFVTGLLLALPLLNGDSLIEITPPFESRSYAELTVKVMFDFGVKAEWLPDSDGIIRLFVNGSQKYKPCDCSVEGDYSQLGFFGAAAAIGGKLSCKGLDINSVQGDRVILDILSRFGADITTDKTGTEAVISISASENGLKGCEIDLADCPDLGPALMVAAAFAKGETLIYNAGRLRIKESDRLAAMEQELKLLNTDLQIDGESMIIKGRRPLTAPVTVQTHNDHRIAMSLAVFAAYAEQPVTLLGADCVAKSYPDFFKDFAAVGGNVN